MGTCILPVIKCNRFISTKTSILVVCFYIPNTYLKPPLSQEQRETNLAFTYKVVSILSLKPETRCGFSQAAMGRTYSCSHHSSNQIYPQTKFIVKPNLFSNQSYHLHGDFRHCLCKH